MPFKLNCVAYCTLIAYMIFLQDGMEDISTLGSSSCGLRGILPCFSGDFLSYTFTQWAFFNHAFD